MATDEENRLAQLEQARKQEPDQEKPEEPRKKSPGRKKIGTISIIFMLGTALLVDGIQALLNFAVAVPFLGFITAPIASIIGIGAGILFFLWFWFLGVKKWRAQGAVIGALIISAVPLLNLLPEWILSVGLTIISVNYGSFVLLSLDESKQ